MSKILTPQKSLLTLFGRRDSFNPLTYDAGNLVALYDGDTLNTDPAGTWGDRSANNFDLTLFNNPTIINNAINGHDALQFDGINQYADRNLTPILNQPISIYIVFKQITNNFNHRIYSSNPNTVLLYNTGLPFALDMYAGNSAPTVNPAMLINTYDIITNVFNGINSETRTNNNAANVGNSGVVNGTGFTLAAFGGGGINYGNIEIAYIILRGVADNTATQNLFINYLKNRFAL